MALLSIFLKEMVIFALYVFVCLTLLKPRFSFVLRVSVYGAVITGICGASAVISLLHGAMTALTLLPITAYLPFSICVFILSECGVFEAAAAFSVGVLASLVIKLIKQFLQTAMTSLLNGVYLNVIVLITVMILAAAAAFVVFRYMRKTFRICARFEMKNRLLIVVPAVTVFLMIFANLNSTASFNALVMTLIIVVSFFAIVSRLFAYSAMITEADENEKRLCENLHLQRENFERISQSVEAGRHYRHDMRHHLKTLAGLAQQSNSAEILEYIEKLNGTAELTAPEMFCKNSAANAVLSEYVNRAKDLGCRTEYKIFLPEELPFDLPDVCIILSNALDNALNACEKCPPDKRFVDLTAVFSDDCKLKILVKNSCAEINEIDADGLPVLKTTSDDHGLGLRGVKKTAEKYNGFICCAYEDGNFVFCAEIFRIADSGGENKKAPKRTFAGSKALTAVVTSIVCVIGILNFSPSAAAALSDLFSVDIKTISYGWGDNKFSAEYPVFDGDHSEKANQAVRDFIGEAKDIFRQYAARKYEGYVAEDAGYRIYINDNSFLSARFYSTVNIGSSLEYSRCVVIDKKKDKVLSLLDLFDENYDYIAEISAEILREMELRVKYMNASYFIPGGIWKDEECFKEISEDQDFYINSNGNIVIVFEECTVAASKEGAPEFVMPDNIFSYK